MKCIWIIRIMCLVLIGCTDSNEKTELLVQEKLRELREDLVKEKTMECEKQILSQLEHKADSILIFLSKRTKYDSLTIPYDSIRPVKPEIEFPGYKKPKKPELDTSIHL
jgi:hypothetical protein